METGRKIMNLRKDRGVAQSSLAEMTSVTPSALSRIEAGIHQPRGSVALRIAKELGVTVDYILDENAPYPPPPKALLENLLTDRSLEIRDQKIKVTSSEKKLLKLLRELSTEEQHWLETIMTGKNREVKLALFALGRQDLLTHLDETEMSKLREALTKL